MMLKITCPECTVVGSISLLETNYQGPYKCWKCKALFKIELKDNELRSCEPLSQEEFEKMKQIHDLKAKFKRD